MLHKLCLVTVLALATIAPLTARAQDASLSESVAVAAAHARYDASETSYAQASGANGDGGLAGQLQQLATAGNSAQAGQLLQARSDARAGLESSIASYLGALKTQYDAAQAAGQSDQAQAIVARVQELRSRLQTLATDAVNEKLAAKGFAPNGTSLPTGSSASGASGALSGATGASSPNITTSPTTPSPLVSTTNTAAAAPAPLDPGPMTVSGDARTQERPAGKPRKATGRLVVVVRGDTPEATRERLEKALALLRAGKPLEPVQGDVYLVERFRDRTPSWVLLAPEARAPELEKLRLHPGATCSVSGSVDASTEKGQIVALRDWKLLALSASDRIVPVTPRTNATKPAPEKPSSPGPLEEDFND